MLLCLDLLCYLCAASKLLHVLNLWPKIGNGFSLSITTSSYKYTDTCAVQKQQQVSKHAQFDCKNKWIIFQPIVGCLSCILYLK